MSSKKLIILISVLIIVLLGVSTYIAWRDRNARRAGGPAPAPMTEEDILRSLAPMTARELSAEEREKEKEILKQLGAQTKKISSSDAEKEKEILRILAAPNK